MLGTDEVDYTGVTQGFIRPDGVVFFRLLKGVPWWVTEKRFVELKRSEQRHGEKWRARHPERARQNARTGYARSKALYKERAKRWGKSNPSRLQAIRKRRAQKIQNTPELRVARNLRTRLRMSFLAGYSRGRAQDKEAVAFLTWLLPQMGPPRKFHIDHLKPISMFSRHEVDLINRPENVRWLPAKKNLAKAAKLPPREEICQHLMLVLLWKLQKKH